MAGEKEIHRTSIGGQAVIEGVMMRGPHKSAIAVRKPDGEIETKVDDLTVKKRKKIWKLPIVRGCIAFVESMVTGVKALMFSAQYFDIEEDGEPLEPSKFDAFLDRHFGDKVKDIVIYFSVFLSLIFSVGLFILLPTFLVTFVKRFIPLDIVATLTEGVIRILIFIGYLALVSQMKDIKRVFMYHGAEHKTIFCYEYGEELTVENARKQTRLHPRCGTSFLLIVMVISILVFSFISWSNPVLRVVLRLALLPVVAGIAYEIIKFAGRHDNAFTRIISWPGMMLQKLTTREPDDSQLEVAITSLKAVLPDNKEDDRW